MSVLARITIGLLVTQAVLFFTGLLASDTSYALWAFGGATSCILMMIGAMTAPIAILVGLFGRKASVRRCGYALLILNTIPLVVLLFVGHFLFGDQYEDRKADGTSKTDTGLMGTCSPLDKPDEKRETISNLAPTDPPFAAQGAGGR